MKQGHWFRTLTFPALGVLVLLATGAGWDSPVRIGDGEVHEGGISSLNGKIEVGHGATVGKCRSVNGAIEIGDDARIDAVSSVNGGIEIGTGTVVERGVSSVNGRITLDRRARAEELDTVNGGIRLTGAEVSADVTTINGDILLRDGSRVGGDIVIEDRRSGSDKRRRPLRIELEGGSVVEGDILVEDADTDVEVYLRDGSRVMGQVEGARVVEGAR